MTKRVWVVKDDMIVVDTNSGEFNHVAVPNLNYLDLYTLATLLNNTYELGRRSKAEEIKDCLNI